MQGQHSKDVHLKKELGMRHLLASCPNCYQNSLYCGMISTTIKTLSDKEVLFCKACKFVVTVDDYKKILLRT